MSKRTGTFERRKNDAYDTPAKACSELLKHLLPGTWFIEPCAGTGELRGHLKVAGHVCLYSFDIEPRGKMIGAADARTEKFEGMASCFITNPPWTRELLHPIIANLSGQLPTWLLFDADWIHNASTPKGLIDICERVVAQGRVKWIPDSKHQGVDNVAWYRFDATHTGGPRFFNRRGR